MKKELTLTDYEMMRMVDGQCECCKRLITPSRILKGETLCPECYEKRMEENEWTPRK
jgi:hypothetical protein